MRKDDARTRILAKLAQMGRKVDDEVVEAYLLASDRLLNLHEREQRGRGKTKLSLGRSINAATPEWRRLHKLVFGTDKMQPEIDAEEDQRWRRKLECDEGWRRHWRNFAGQTGFARAQAETTTREM